jgi:23S rRNA pseudouridine1911/1915/1917 synthase
VNDGYEYREAIGPRGAGRTILAYLSDRYRHSSEAAWRERLAAGQVFLDGVPAREDGLLRVGQSLVWRRPPWSEPPVPLAYAVLYRDPDLLAVAKPRGLPSVPNGGFLTHTLLHLVRGRYSEAAPLHRLGRGTSGLVLFARTDEARRSLTAAWREGAVEKRYLALVSGVPRERAFTIDAAIGPVPHPRLGRVHAASPAGKPAITHVRVLGTNGRETLVEALIPTGRPHQIRIHLAAAGHPLVGDPLYAPGGLPRDESPGLPGDPGYRLHAHRLGFVHPTTGRRLEIECPPPPPLDPRLIR